MTLSSNSGEVPVSVTNGSTSPLALTLTARSSTIRLPGLPRGKRVRLIALPGENLLTLPVDMQGTTAGTLRTQLSAGPLTFATAECTVRGSYNDELVLVGTVVLVLLALLWYIRRKEKPSVRDVSSDSDVGPDAGTTTGRSVR